MLDHTFAALEIIYNGFKRIIFIIELITQLTIIAHLGYSIYSGKGNLIANIVLITLSVAYLIFFVATRKMNNKDEKKIKKITKRAVTYSKLFINATTLAAALYGAVIAFGNMSAIDIILLSLSFIGWVMQAIIQIVILYIDAQINLIRTAFEMDLENIRKPITLVEDTFKRISGKEDDTATSTPSNAKTRKRLTAITQALREERKAKRAGRGLAAIFKKGKKEDTDESINKVASGTESDTAEERANV